MLTIRNLSSYYGNIQILKKVNMEIPDGKIVALLGPNGAGKTTTMMSVSGLVKLSPDSEILFENKNLAGMKPEAIVKQGITQVPQGRGIFPGLTIRENLIMGAYLRHSSKEIDDDIEKNIDMFPLLKERYTQLAGTLSGGEQQLLAIMRGLMARPKLLMLDEPSMGLAPIMVEQVYETIIQIGKSGLTILLVEQNTNMSLAQGRGIFPGLTIRENLIMGAYLRHSSKEIDDDIEKNIDMFPRLKEPSMGLAPIMVEQVYETIIQIGKSGLTILLVEQNTNMSLAVSDYAYILSSGTIVREGESAELKKDENMLQSYFGG